MKKAKGKTIDIIIFAIGFLAIVLTTAFNTYTATVATGCYGYMFARAYF